MVTAKYSRAFKAVYDQLPPDVQRQFFFADAAILKGEFGRMRREPFDRYVAYLDAKHAAYGKLLQKNPKPDAKPGDPPEFVFLWIFIGSKKDVPVVL